VKLSEKFARQESESERLARIARRRISDERAEAIRQFLGIVEDGSPVPAAQRAKRSAGAGTHVCELCGRAFSLPMHLGRHKRSAHKTSSPVSSSDAPGVGI
jgi:hypothetical protein